MPSASLYVAVPVPNSVCTDDTVSGSLPRGPRSEEVSRARRARQLPRHTRLNLPDTEDSSLTYN